ncbi:MAG: alpha/beta hydrolase family protein, partial [Bdellovibrionota bacterium]
MQVKHPGKHKIALSGLVLFDSARRRRIPVEIFYPKSKGRFPVLFFSPGNRVPAEAYFFLAKYWAAHGYVCILPTHEGPSERLEGARFWKLRPQDISFCIDSLALLERRIPGLRKKIDSKRIGMAGHSHGAYTTLLLAGARIDETGRRLPRLADRRIQAFIAVSPPGTSRLGMKRKSFASLASPLLTISGELDRDLHFRKPASWRLDPYLYAPPSPGRSRHHVLFPGADHYSFFDALTIHADTFALPDPGILKLQQAV